MMAKLTNVLVLLVFATACSMVATSGDTLPGLQARRSRFLLGNSAFYNSPLPSYDCSKKTAAICLAPGSPGPSCCGGQCVDTIGSNEHCGGCNKVCKHGRMCCGGRCVDLLKDKDNCGTCFNQCGKKCSYGFCDYAQ